MSYIPNTDADRAQMLEAMGLGGMDDLFAPIPEALRFRGELNIPHRLDQIALARHVARLAKRNAHAEEMPCFLGAGVYDHYVPPTVGAITGRSEFYTSYTPYQPEVSQGVLQSIFEFQTLLCELLAMDVANASMYDGATALAEAALMAADLTGRGRLIVPETTHPIHRHVLDTYVKHLGLAVDWIPQKDGVSDGGALHGALSDETAAVIVQHPNFFGHLEDVRRLGEAAHAQGALLVVSADPISLGLLTPPGEYGADIVVGEGQGMGCPMGYGGPLLGLFACKRAFMRRLPGRIVGQTTSEGGKRAFVMTLRTREQDIRRERATSNICTNEALNALAATVYLATMGQAGLRHVAELCLQKSHYAADEIANIPGYSLAFPGAAFFKEFVVRTPVPPEAVNEHLLQAGILGGLPLGPYYPDLADAMLFCVTEQRTKDEIDALVAALPRRA
ncbi:MAG: aminomethyl-transferring glycine dehydrogenase subunit GcvPA [Armatimonadetes bacterium]|nr:aminomethyl-transferring glycine dehydrogenase subunit GcvPA [Armatimonadota bacterium]